MNTTLHQTKASTGKRKYVSFAKNNNIETMASDQEKKELQERFVAKLGAEAFHTGWESLLSVDPAFFSASLSLASVPRQKSHLSRKDQSLISLAVDSAATHLYAPGIRVHVAAALKEGATIHEVLEVIELSSTLGIHACNIGVPLLVEVLKEEGKYEDEITKAFDERQEKLKKEFTEKRGYWHTFWEDFLRLDPEFFEAYLEFSSVPWVKNVGGNGGSGRGALEPKVTSKDRFPSMYNYQKLCGVESGRELQYND